MTYTNNDYGKGLADSIQAAFESHGGQITAVAAHEDGKADYSAEVGSLAAAGGEVLIVAGYLDQGGKGMIQASLDSGAFDRFVLPDGMVGESLTATSATPSTAPSAPTRAPTAPAPPCWRASPKAPASTGRPLRS
jgi:ABC-type branched-subunit amino acid transport system substrate-binding protein